jgi:hypothetical protein
MSLTMGSKSEKRLWRELGLAVLVKMLLLASLWLAFARNDGTVVDTRQVGARMAGSVTESSEDNHHAQ